MAHPITRRVLFVGPVDCELLPGMVERIEDILAAEPSFPISDDPLTYAGRRDISVEPSREDSSSRYTVADWHLKRNSSEGTLFEVPCGRREYWRHTDDNVIFLDVTSHF